MIIESVFGLNRHQRLNRARRGHLHPVIEMVKPFFEVMQEYHDYSVIGIEHIPKLGKCILAMSHSFATYDALLLGLHIKNKIGRLPVGLADNRLFDFPGVSAVVSCANLFRANSHNAKQLLQEECLLGVLPGGMREALRSNEDKYKVSWAQRKGFVRLAIETGTPVVLAACPAADDIYDVYRSKLTEWMYRRYKLPIPVVRGWGLGWMPRPIKLTHYLSAPFAPPKVKQDQITEQLVDEFHEQLVTKMQGMMLQSCV